MPKLSKIRLTGCKYDGLRKEHENSIFDLTRGENPDHSLFTLENGGGKGVMMQLIFQLLLPETKWGKNNGNQVISMFYDKRNNLHPFTFHVILEWELDTFPKKRLLTGIAVKSIIKNTSSGEDDKTGLSYYLYTYEHDNNGYYSVENLPLYDNRKQEAVDLDIFEDFLNDNKKDFIKYSQTSGKRKDSEYYTYLQSRGIHRNEWITLKEINKSEGGISDYFNRASDNKSIFDKVIIPAISENIRNYSYDDGNNLIEMFKSNLSITKDLPVLLKRESDYKELAISIGPLIENADSGRRFIELKDRFICQGNDIFYILKDEMEIVSDEIKKWTISKSDAEEENKDLNFKKDSLFYDKERRDYLAKVNQLDKLSEDYAKRDLELKAKNEELVLYKINEVLIAKKDIEKEIENKIIEKEMLIKTLNMDHIKERANELDLALEIEWESVIEKWRNEEISYKGYINYTDDAILESKTKKKKYEGKKEELQNEINKFKLEKENLALKKNKLEKIYDPMTLSFPERILQDLNISKENLDKKRGKVLSDKELLEKRKDYIIEEKNKTNYILSQNKEKFKKLNEKIQNKQGEEIDLARNVCKVLLKEYDGSLLDENWFLKNLEDIEDLYRTRKKNLEDIERNIWSQDIQRSLNTEDYFIPNNDVLYLKDEIKKLDIHVETGTEYLNGLLADERNQILKDNIGFVYSLVITNQRDWEIIDKNIDRNILLNNMVPIYIRSEMGNRYETNFRHIFARADDLVSDNIYIEWKNEMEDKFNKLSNTKEKIEKDIKSIESIIQELKVMLKTELVFSLDRNARDIEKEIEENTVKIRSFEQEILDLENKTNIANDDLENINKKLYNLDETIKSMKDYIYEKEKIQERQLIIDAVNKDLKEIIQEILSIDEDIEDIRYRQYKIKDGYNEWRINIKNVEKRVKHIYNQANYSPKLDENYRGTNIPTFDIELNKLNLIMNERETIEKDINSKNSELAVLDSELKHFNLDLGRYNIKLNEISEKWDEYVYLNIPLIEVEIIIRALVKQISEIERQRIEIKSESDEIKGMVRAIKSNVEKLEKQIQKDHKRAPIILESEDIDREINNVDRDLKSNKEFLYLCISALEKNKEKKNKLELNYNRISHRNELDFTKGKMDNILKEKLLNNPDLVVEEWLNKISRNEREIDKTKIEGETLVNRFIKNIQINLQEDRLRDKISEEVGKSNIANFRNNKETFKSMENHFRQELIQLSKDKEKAEEAMRQWTERASIYVLRMIETLKEMISSMNYTNEGDHVFPLVKLKGGDRLPKEKDEIKHLLEEHFINSISETLEKDEDIDVLDNKIIEKLMGDNVIFSKALQGRYPTLLVYKMTEKNEFKYARPREEHYTTWEAINKGEGISTEGSGGQTLSITTFVIMMILSFKKKHIGNEKPSTVLILDNPFGKASGKHVLDPIFEIADKLHFQLICFAAPEIIKVEISERFPVFWELKIENGKVIHGGRIIKE